jgi:Bacterial Ig domain
MKTKGRGRFTRFAGQLMMVGALALSATATANTLPRRFLTNPLRAQRAWELAHPGLEFPPLDGGSQGSGNPDGGDLEDGYEFWWIGATSPNVSLPNSGVQTVLQEVDTQPPGFGCFDCWTSEYLDNDYWGQVGFSNCTAAGESPTVGLFYQVWDVASNTIVGEGGSDVASPGLHTFAMSLQSGTTWAYSVDGNVFGLFDMKSATSSQPSAIGTFCEEGDGVTAPFVPPTISVPITFSLLNQGVWSGPAEGLAYNTANLSGVEGNLQDNSLPNGAIQLGGDSTYVVSNTPLWNGATNGFAPDAGPAGTGALAPPLVAITSPAPNSSLSGTVTETAVIVNPAGASEITEAVYAIQNAAGDTLGVATLTHEPYRLVWDTTQYPNGVYYLSFGAVDSQGRSTTFSEIETIDNPTGTSSGTTGASGTTSGQTGTGSSSTGSSQSSSGSSGGSTGGQTTGSSSGSTDVGTPAHGGCSSVGGEAAPLLPLLLLLLLRRQRVSRRSRVRPIC